MWNLEWEMLWWLASAAFLLLLPTRLGGEVTSAGFLEE